MSVFQRIIFSAISIFQDFSSFDRTRLFAQINVFEKLFSSPSIPLLQIYSPNKYVIASDGTLEVSLNAISKDSSIKRMNFQKTFKNFLVLYKVSYFAKSARKILKFPRDSCLKRGMKTPKFTI